MNLDKKNTSLVFFTALLPTLIIPIFFPSIRVNYFIPFLVILFYKKPFIACLWASLGCGLILDLLSPHSKIGVNAINFTITTGLLYRQRRHFFADSISTLPIMTLFFSIFSTILQIFLVNLFEKHIAITKGWIVKDLLLMPTVDSIFAFCVYVLPSLIIGKPNRKGKDYFMQQEEQ